MASNIADYLASELIDHFLRNSAYSPAATVYVAFLLMLDVLFVLKAREQGMLLSVSSIPGMILVANRMIDNRLASSSSSDAKAET